jgi:hypothetical protein
VKRGMLQDPATFAKRLEAQIDADSERAQREPLPADLLHYAIQSLAINDPLGPPRLSGNVELPHVLATPYGRAAIAGYNWGRQALMAGDFGRTAKEDTATLGRMWSTVFGGKHNDDLRGHELGKLAIRVRHEKFITSDATTIDEAFSTWMREGNIPDAILRLPGDVRSAFDLGAVIAALWTAIQFEQFRFGRLQRVRNQPWYRRR